MTMLARDAGLRIFVFIKMQTNRHGQLKTHLP
jgi:hypothetical protein